MEKDLLKRIADSVGLLSVSESKVAACIIDEPEIVRQHGMAGIAMLAGVSEPTVLRFCRSLGFTGFREFKEIFTVYLVSGGLQKFMVLDEDNCLPDIVLRKRLTVKENIGNFLDGLDLQEMENVADALTDSSFIIVITEQELLPVAWSMHNIFLRSGKFLVVYRDDTDLLETVRAASSQADVIFFLSTDGDNKLFLEIVRLAERNGITSICMTRQYSNLAAECDLVLYFPEKERAGVNTLNYQNFCGMLLVDILGDIIQKKAGVSSYV